MSVDIRGIFRFKQVYEEQLSGNWILKSYQLNGYFGGGDSGPGPTSIVDRIDYSNDTATASPRGPLSIVRYGLGASSAAANDLPQ